MIKVLQELCRVLPVTHRQGALADVGSDESIDGSVLGVSGRQTFHLVLVNPAEHQDRRGGEDDQDDHRGNDHDYQGGHAVVRTLNH